MMLFIIGLGILLVKIRGTTYFTYSRIMEKSKLIHTILVLMMSINLDNIAILNK